MKTAATSIDGASELSHGSDLSSTAPNPARVPILYVILSVLLVISIVPMYFYSARVEAINRDRLKTNEMLLQNTVTRSLADDLSQHERSLRMMLANLSSAIQVASGGDIGGKNIQAPELRALLENFVSSSDELAYATLLNSEAKGVSAGRIAPDAFLQRELQHAYDAARDGRAYNGHALQVEDGKSARTVVSGEQSRQLRRAVSGHGGHGRGFAIPDSPPARSQRRRSDSLRRGRSGPAGGCGHAAICDRPGHEEPGDRAQFCGQGNKAQLAATEDFAVHEGKNSVEMLGTYSPVTALDWAVVVQKPQLEAYRGVYEMQRTARLLALLAVLLSIGVSIFAARTHYQSSADPHPVQPRSGAGRLFAAGSLAEPHRNWRTGGDL